MKGPYLRTATENTSPSISEFPFFSFCAVCEETALCWKDFVVLLCFKKRFSSGSILGQVTFNSSFKTLSWFWRVNHLPLHLLNLTFLCHGFLLEASVVFQVIAGGTPPQIQQLYRVQPCFFRWSRTESVVVFLDHFVHTINLYLKSQAQALCGNCFNFTV